MARLTMAAVGRHGPPDDGVDPARHLLCRTSGERQQQDAFGTDAGNDQMRHPMRQGHGLAGARPGDDQQRPGSKRVLRVQLAVFGCLALRRVQQAQVVIDALCRLHCLPSRERYVFLYSTG